MKEAAVSRADLVRMLGGLDGAALAAAAGLLGWVRESSSTEPATRDRPALPEGGRRRLAGPEPEPLPWAKAELDLAPVPFLRVVEAEHFGAEREVRRERARAITPDGLEPVGRRPPPEALAPWSRLWPALQAALHALLPSLEIDVDEVVRRWSRGEHQERLPVRDLLAWSSRVVLVLDWSRRLCPFWRDEVEILRRLRRLLGERVVHPATLLAGPGSPLFEGERAGRFPPGAPLLALTDLGLLGQAEVSARWLEWGRELSVAGHRLTALVPAPPDRWGSELARLWQPVWWDRGSAAVRPRAADFSARRETVARLLRLVSFAGVVEPGLLRAVRRLLPAAEADSSVEAEAWNHPAIARRSPDGAVFDPAWRRELLASLSEEPLELVSRSAGLVRAWHASRPREFWSQEAEALERACPGVLPAEEAATEHRRLERIARAVADQVGDRTPFGRGLEAWFRRQEVRIDAATWADERLGPVLAEAWVRVHRAEPAAEPPPGLPPRLLAQAREVSSTLRRWEARQVGGEIQLWPQPSPGDFSRRPGSLLADLKASEPSVRVREVREGLAGEWRRLPLDASIPGTGPLGPTDL